MTRTTTYDARLTGTRDGRRQSLSILVEAETHEEARARALGDCEAGGWEDLTIDWCIEYPPKRKVRPTRAITDE